MRTIGLVVAATIVSLVMVACTDHKESGEKVQDDARRTAVEMVTKRQQADAAMGHAVERWSILSRDVPPLLDQLNSRIELRAGKRATTDAERDALANDRAALADLRSGWLQAGSAFASGQAIEAVKEAEDVARRGRERLRRVSMESSTPPPDSHREPIRGSPATTLRTDR